MSNVHNLHGKGKTNQTDDEDHWVTQLQRGEKGKLVSNAYNMDLVVQNDNFFKDLYWFNDMTRTLEIRDRAGWRSLEDADLADAHIYTQRFYLRTIGYPVVKEVIYRNCMRNRRHPVKDWLNSLIWDREERLKDWLINYCKAEPSAYVCAVGKMFMISAVARIFNPGCQCDYVLVLEGEQGDNKTSVWRILFERYHTEMHLTLDNKDASIHVSRFWCVELSEMAQLNRQDSALLKSFITRCVEQYRMVGLALTVDYPRQCVIAATNNDSSYLKDPTGNRRWWGVKVGLVDRERLAEDREQLFAEAVHLFKTGVPWWPNRDFEKQFIKPEQEARLVVDEMYEMVGAHVNGPLAYVTETNVLTIWRLLWPNAPDPTCPVPLQNRIRTALKLHGFEPGGRTNKGRQLVRPPRAGKE